MLVVSKRMNNRGIKPKPKTQKIIDKLTIFYDKYYKSLINENDIVYDDKLKQILLYEAIDMVKNINVNIAEHYVQYVKRFIISSM